MSRQFTYRISSTDHDSQVLSFLRSIGFSRHILASMKPYPGLIRLNGEHAGGKTVLKEGDILTVTLPPEPVNEHIIPTELPLHILYEDEDILVINKPADMPIHPSIGNYENTLANAVAWYFKDSGEPFTYRCINRLDRDTTGALILAKNALSGAILSDAVKQRKIKRTYLALAEAMIPDRGVITAPIARKDGSTIERCVDFRKGEKAVTYFERLDYHHGLSLVELHLETGRTHQIRVHMKYLGHPLPGDFLYYPHTERISRQALHSYQIAFTHPITKKELCLQAPLPQDFLGAWG